MTPARAYAAVVLASALAGAPSLSAASGRPVSFRTEDGVAIAGSFYEASRRPAPAVVLLHMQTRSREDWQGVAMRLADAGIDALAIDFRGHGGSGRGVPAADGEPDYARWVLDAKAACTFLGARPDLVRAARLGIAGASIGANVALAEAADNPAVHSVALLSPGLDYHGLRADAAMRKFGARPALLVAATDDPYALRSAKTLATLGGGPRETRTPENGGHGTVMLGRDPDLADALVDWFRRTLL